MNILLINPPGKISFISPPLGILYIAASLQENGHKISVLDYNLEKLDYERLHQIIMDKKIEIVGISIVTPKVFEAMKLAKFIKEKFPNIAVVAGGPHATLEPEELMKKCPAIDFIIQGEGELRMKDFISHYQDRNSLEELDGLVLREGSRIINNKPQSFIIDLNKIPLPARELIDMDGYARRLKTSWAPATTMMTSRGCPFQCIYCSKPITGLKIRSMAPENVIKEIEYLKDRFGIREIIFYDDTFTFDRERIMKICDLMTKNNLNIRWQCETRVTLVDRELLEKMKEAGCYMIAYGIESGNDRILKILQKAITTEQVRKAVNLAKQTGIQILGYFMMGIPGETEEEIKQTIKFSHELDIDFAQFSIATAYPGTELYRIAKDQNKLTSDWSKSIYALGGKPLVSLSDVPINKLYKYTKKAYRSFYFRPSYIWKRIMGIRSFNDLIYNLRGLKTLLEV